MCFNFIWKCIAFQLMRGTLVTSKTDAFDTSADRTKARSSALSGTGAE